MTTVKADAHFVDCDLATGSGSWTSDQDTSTVLAAIYNLGKCYILGSDYEVAVTGETTEANTSGVDISPTEQIMAFGNGVTSGSEECIFLYDWDGNRISSPTFTQGDNFDSKYNKRCQRLRFSPDGNTIYATYRSDVGGQSHLFAFNVSDGSTRWVYPNASSSVTDTTWDNFLYVHDDGNILVYRYDVGQSPTKFLQLIDSDGNDVETYARFPDSNDVESGYITYYNGWYFVATVDGGPPNYYTIYASDGNTTLQTSLGGTDPDAHMRWPNIYRGYLYVAGTRANGKNVFKLDPTDLNPVASANCTSPDGWDDCLCSMAIGYDGESIVCFTNDEFSSANTQIWIFDLNLELKSGYPKSLTDFSVGASRRDRWLQAYPSQWIVGGGGSQAISTQYRTTAYQQNWDHLEGQEVQLLLDGTHLDDYTYVISGGVPVAQ